MRNAQIREKSLFSKKIMGKIRAKYKKKIYHLNCRYFLAVNNDTKLSALSFSFF